MGWGLPDMAWFVPSRRGDSSRRTLWLLRTSGGAESNVTNRANSAVGIMTSARNTDQALLCANNVWLRA